MAVIVRTLLMIAAIDFACAAAAWSQNGLAQVSIRVERHVEGAPLTFGIPFPKGALYSPDEVRVVTLDGHEVPSQITEVSTWAPADDSIKWIWVFFFAQGNGPLPARVRDRRAPAGGGRNTDQHSQQPAGERNDRGVDRTAAFHRSAGRGRLPERGRPGPRRRRPRPGRGRRWRHRRTRVLPGLVDEAGIDRSRAFVRRAVIEKGSGPLHAIVRIEGEYRYNRPDNRPAPFVTRIHAYAGRSYVRVQHTFVYTGIPDRHRAQHGDYPHVATEDEQLIAVDPSDTGWTVPEDRIAAAGLSVGMRQSGDRRLTTRLREGAWWSEGTPRTEVHDIGGAGEASLLQTGPEPLRMPPVRSSSTAERMDGFSTRLDAGGRTLAEAQRADGWAALSDGRYGVAIGIRHFLEEYPKEIRFGASNGMEDEATAYLWSPEAEPMSFARFSNEVGPENAVENWAAGLAKTSEVVFDFHPAGTSDTDLARTMSAVVGPPVAHADPEWYGGSGVYGRFAPSTGSFPHFERALDYKFDWVLFNQRWEPWFGMFDHGDLRNSFDGTEWSQWGHGEPAQDYMLWLQFMRTGKPELFDAAQAASRHLMDVDNTHWPRGPVYYGDTNQSVDYWRSQDAPPASKYLGIGRRHAEQHWLHVLSAHVWVQGWLADYYLAADHRGLEVAVQTAELHLRRIWGEHGLTGRRLYLSVWNLVEVWDATKDERYRRELEDRVRRMLRFQEREQGGSLVMDRYGYTHVYVAHGLWRYLDLTGDDAVRTALIRSARRARDVPPLDHTVESLLSSVSTLAFGYALSEERSLLDEMKLRIEVLRMEPLPRPIDESWTQGELFEALDALDGLPQRSGAPPGGAGPQRGGGPPRGGGPRRAGWSYTNGLRVFGWTHAYSLPYVLDLLRRDTPETAPPTGAR